MHSAEAYAEFRAAYPSSPKAVVAERKEEVLRWEHAQHQGDAQSYRAYIHAHPGGPHGDEARRELDHAMFREAAGDRRAMQTYLVYQQVSGAHIPEAEAALEELDWSDARAVGTSDAYGSYLLHHPEGGHAMEAAALRDGAIWQKVSEKDSVYSYRRYLDDQRSGHHRDEAEARIEALTFDKAKIAVRARSTWRGQGAALAANMAHEIRRDWVMRLYGLGYGTSIAVVTSDLTAVSEPEHPLDTWTVEPGTALFVVDLDERRGMRMEPYYATIIKGTVTLYASGKREALSSGWVEARTSAYVDRISQEGMHVDAELRLSKLLWSAVRAQDFLRVGIVPNPDLPAPPPARRRAPTEAPSSKKSLSDRIPR